MMNDDTTEKQDSWSKLAWLPPKGLSYRWLPRDGVPLWKGEWLSQALIKILAWLPIYIAIIVTLVLLIQIFGIPYVGGA